MSQNANTMTTPYTGLEIAIIGMAGRFPGAPDLEQFWNNLQQGVESISFFSDQEVLEAGIDPQLANDPNYIKAGGVLEGIEQFDADFFNLSPREAEITDPQHRLFLEIAWQALEKAGYDPSTSQELIGVYGGASISSYLISLLGHPHLKGYGDELQLLIGNDKDFLATRTSYKLGLEGPSYSVQTACSTSLVAVHLACQGLLSGECDIALAGGVSIRPPQKTGYLYREGGVRSPDGHCRAFDAQAQGAINGNGLGLVVLKRLQEAMESGDQILAVIKGSAINNDGSLKVSYTAPRVDSQASVIRAAHEMAEVDPDTIDYVEAHGTGTPLGDPIEVTALTQAFRTQTQRVQFCRIGSVKTNIGHLDVAAGIAGLIKTVLSLYHHQIPASLHFQTPNPQIDLANSPFRVNAQLSEWPAEDGPRRAGVSSFGIGGTNAHVILEEAPPRSPSNPSRSWQLLLISAQTPTALEQTTVNLAVHLRHHPALNLADVAYTLQVGRRAFDHRRLLLCQTSADAAQALDPLDPQRVLTQTCDAGYRPVVFMFPGQGSQYINMGRDLYESEPNFRETVDQCCDLLLPHLELDLRKILYPQSEEQPAQALQDTSLAQPALFVLEYALAQLWIHWGIKPQALLGHSLGEIVAACVSGVFTLEDALTLVAQRGKRMQSCPPGAMLSVQLPEIEIRSWLKSQLTLAAHNAPDLWVVSGPPEEIDQLENQLVHQDTTCRRLHVSHGFHSPLMIPVREPLLELLGTLDLQTPQIPFLSTLTGTWITPQEATDPQYWAKLLEHPVRFSEICAEILSDSNRIFLEVGPGRTLSTLLHRHTQQEIAVFPSLRHPQADQSDVAFLLTSRGRRWLAGLTVDWQAFAAQEHRHRLPLPTYPFERQRYWIDPLRPQREVEDSEVWPALMEAVRSQGQEGWQELNTPEHQSAQQILNQLCIAYMDQGLQQMGAWMNSGGCLSLAEIVDQCSIIPRYHQLMDRWLTVLTEAGYLDRDTDRFSRASRAFPEVSELLTEAQIQGSDRPQMIERIRFCGENLRTVLQGEQEPLTLFLTLAEQQTQQPDPELPLYRHLKGIVRSAIRAMVQGTPAKQLRILEIGGGQGSVTREILPLLPVDRTQYCFTDIGGLFLRLAEQRFSDYPFMAYQPLDIEGVPTEQGFSPHSFDSLIAVNVLHVTRQLRETIAHVRSLLASGGILILWEITQAQPEFDLTDGLLMNPLEDQDRSHGNPFWSAATWREELQAQGFSEVAVIPEGVESEHHIILARAPELPSLPRAFPATVNRSEPNDLGLDQIAKKKDIADWFYLPSWKRSLPPQSGSAQDQHWLLFLDDLGVGVQLANRLQQDGRQVTTVVKGEHFSCLSDPDRNGSSRLAYTLNPQEPEDYQALLLDLQWRGHLPEQIIHLWSVTQTSLAIDLEISLQEGYVSLLRLAHALSETTTDPTEITVISTGLQDVSGQEMIQPEKSPLLGACRVIPQEYETLSCRSIDIPPPSMGQMSQVVDLLRGELLAETTEPVIAYRGSYRWIQSFEPIPISASEERSLLRCQGVYLITGGLGSVGLTLAEELARSQKAKLILVSRTELPPRETWHEDNHPETIRHKIQKVLTLESLGSEVQVARADVTDQEQMDAVVQATEARFGPINGVIHAAVEIHKQLIRDCSNTLELSTSAKLKGALVLDQIFKETDLDFLLICSSQAAYLGGLRMVAYTAENSFLDAFAHYRTHQQDAYTLSVNWDRWTQMENVDTSGSLQRSYLRTELRSGLSPEEGIEVFHRVLSQRSLSQIIVSTQSFQALIHRTSLDLKGSLDSLRGEWFQSQLPQTSHPRPNLPTPYMAPRNDVEQTLTELWQQVLGIIPVGIHDNFFDLGGDSLTATVLVSQASQRFGIDVPFRQFFQTPTVAASAQIILEALGEGADQEMLAEALAEIEDLSEEEVEQQLAQDQAKEGMR